METNKLIEALRQDTEMMADGTREGLTKAWHDEVMKDSAKDCSLAADRLSEQQQVIDELVNAMEMIAGITPCPDDLMGNVDIAHAALSRVKGHTKETE